MAHTWKGTCYFKDLTFDWRKTAVFFKAEIFFHNEPRMGGHYYIAIMTNLKIFIVKKIGMHLGQKYTWIDRLFCERKLNTIQNFKIRQPRLGFSEFNSNCIGASLVSDEVYIGPMSLDPCNWFSTCSFQHFNVVIEKQQKFSNDPVRDCIQCRLRLCLLHQIISICEPIDGAQSVLQSRFEVYLQVFIVFWYFLHLKDNQTLNSR